MTADELGILWRFVTNNCTCGGSGPGEGCAWCELWHAIGAREQWLKGGAS